MYAYLLYCVAFCCSLGALTWRKKFPPKCDFAYRYIQNDHEHNLEMQKI